MRPLSRFLRRHDPVQVQRVILSPVTPDTPLDSPFNLVARGGVVNSKTGAFNFGNEMLDNINGHLCSFRASAFDNPHIELLFNDEV